MQLKQSVFNEQRMVFIVKEKWFFIYSVKGHGRGRESASATAFDKTKSDASDNNNVSVIKSGRKTDTLNLRTISNMIINSFSALEFACARAD